MRRFLPILVLLLACCLCQADDVKKLLADMKKAYSNAKSVKIEMEMTLPFLEALDPEGEGFGMKIDMSFLAPGKVRVNMKPKDKDDEDEDIILENGKVVWTKSGDHEGDEEDPGDEDEDSDEYGDDGGPHLMFGDFFYDADKLFGTDSKSAFGGTDLDAHNERWNDKQWIVIQETYSKQGIIRRYYVDPETHLIWRCTDSDSDEDKVMADVQVTSIDLNAKIDPDDLKPPK